MIVSVSGQLDRAMAQLTKMLSVNLLAVKFLIVVLWIMTPVLTQDFQENGTFRQATQLNQTSDNVSTTNSPTITTRANVSVITVNKTSPANATFTSSNPTINSTSIVNSTAPSNQTQFNNITVNQTQSQQNNSNVIIGSNGTSNASNSSTTLQSTTVTILVNESTTSSGALSLINTSTPLSNIIFNFLSNASNASSVPSILDRTTPVVSQISNGTGTGTSIIPSSTTGPVTLPSMFILARDNSTQAPISIPSSVFPMSSSPSLSLATTPPSTTATNVLPVSSTLTIPEMANTTRPSIVVNIDIHLGQSSNPSTTGVTSPLSSISMTSVDTTPPVLTSPFPIASSMSTISTTSTPKVTSIPTLAAASALSVAANGTQVVCFSLPFDLLERLLPLIASLGIGGTSQTTSSSTGINGQNASPSSFPLFNPITPILIASSTVPSVPITLPVLPLVTSPRPNGSFISPQSQSETITSSPSTPSNSYPFLGPFGVGSYGGFRPAIENYTVLPVPSIGPWAGLNYTAPPPVFTSTFASVITEARPLNPFPNLQEAAGVIPYYTYPPSSVQSNIYGQNNPLLPITVPSATLAPPVTVIPRPNAIPIQSYNNGYLSNGPAPPAYAASSGSASSVSASAPAAPLASGYGGGWTNGGSWPVAGPSSNTGYSSAQTAFSGSKPVAGSAAAVIGMPGYAFTGSSAGGAYGGGLQAVIVQPSHSWQYREPISTSPAGLASPVAKNSVNKALMSESIVSRQVDKIRQEQDEAAAARNYLCDSQRNIVPDAITVTQDGMMHIFVGTNVFGLREGTNKKQRAVWMGKLWEKWPGIEASIENITAATTRQDGTTFLFSGENYWKFNSNYEMAPDSPKKLAVGFPGVSHLDSVYQAPSSNGDMNFLEGAKYYSYNHKRFPPYRGPLLLKNIGLPDGINQINAAYTDWKSQDVVLVTGHLMYKLSGGKIAAGYPQAFRKLFEC